MNENEKLVVYRSKPLTGEQIHRLDALVGIADESIDFSDHPEADSETMRNAVPGQLYRTLKRQMTLRLDADVLAWFKDKAPDGKGYQTDINRVLREYVDAQRKRTG